MKELEKEIKIFKEEIIFKIQNLSKTTDDKIKAIDLICNESIYNIQGWLEIPDEFRNFFENYCDFERYSTLCYNNLLDYILEYIEERFSEDCVNGNSWYLPKSWLKLDENTLIERAVDTMYYYILDRKIIGCIIDW